MQRGDGNIQSQPLVCLPLKPVFSLPGHMSATSLLSVLQLLVAPPASPILIREDSGCDFSVCLLARDPQSRTGPVLFTTAFPSLKTVPGV